MSKKRDNSWKKRDGVVYSTDENFEYNIFGSLMGESLPDEKQQLLVRPDRKSRAGKFVTLVEGFKGTDEALKALAKNLKTACGVGGSVKDGEILIQGDFIDKVVELLLKDGYKAKSGR